MQEKARKNLPAGSPQPVAVPVTGTGGQLLDDALSALVNLGYREAQAKKVLEAMDIGSGTTVEDIDSVNGSVRLDEMVVVDGEISVVNGKISLERGTRVRNNFV